jgi:hypothetical protein
MVACNDTECFGAHEDDSYIDASKFRILYEIWGFKAVKA